MFLSCPVCVEGEREGTERERENHHEKENREKERDRRAKKATVESQREPLFFLLRPLVSTNLSHCPLLKSYFGKSSSCPVCFASRPCAPILLSFSASQSRKEHRFLSFRGGGEAQRTWEQKPAGARARNAFETRLFFSFLPANSLLLKPFFFGAAFPSPRGPFCFLHFQQSDEAGREAAASEKRIPKKNARAASLAAEQFRVFPRMGARDAASLSLAHCRSPRSSELRAPRFLEQVSA